MFYAQQLNWFGRFGDTLAAVDRGRDAAAHHPYTQIALGWDEALFRGGEGEYQMALGLLRRVVASAEKVGEPLWLARATNLMCWLYAEFQNHQSALAVIDGVAAGLTELTLRDTFLGSEAVLTIRRSAG